MKMENLCVSLFILFSKRCIPSILPRRCAQIATTISFVTWRNTRPLTVRNGYDCNPKHTNRRRANVLLCSEAISFCQGNSILSQKRSSQLIAIMTLPCREHRYQRNSCDRGRSIVRLFPPASDYVGRCHMKVSSSRDPLAYSRKLERTSEQTCPKRLRYFFFF